MDAQEWRMYQGITGITICAQRSMASLPYSFRDFRQDIKHKAAGSNAATQQRSNELNSGQHSLQCQ